MFLKLVKVSLLLKLLEVLKLGHKLWKLLEYEWLLLVNLRILEQILEKHVLLMLILHVIKTLVHYLIPYYLLVTDNLLNYLINLPTVNYL